jgi:flagellar basal-body rod modification protein FlgD
MTTSNVAGLNGIPSYDPAAANAPKAAAGMGTSAAETQDYFMKMLLAQIQNQDPMNAQDPAQMTSQLTQLNTASGIERLNTSISAMLSQATSQQFMNNSALIGSSVLAPGNSLALADAGSADFGLQLAGASAQTTVKVVAADGSVIEELSLGALSQGVHTFSWDGAGYDGLRAPAGAYQLQLAAADAAGAVVGSSSLTRGLVSGVARTDTGSQLLTTDGRTLDPADLIQLTKP